jgi:hypothetical protein
MTLYVSRFTAWAPGLSSAEDWQEWTAGTRRISLTGESPELPFIDPRFRRRLSQISRMTIQVLHDLLPLEEDTGVVFLSFWGELTQQFKINRMLITEGDISPSAFPVSVFNTPPAAASIALNLTAGYSAIYPARNRFADGLLAAAAPILAGTREETALVYADEYPPPEYRGLHTLEPLSFGAALSRARKGDSIPVHLPQPQAVPSPQAVSQPQAVPNPQAELESPQSFLRYLWSFNPSTER